MTGRRTSLAALATLAVVPAFFLAARPNTISASQEQRLASRYRFESVTLRPVDNGQPMRTVRPVNRSLERIRSWVSSVGAAAALADIQGTGLPADICLVDPRNDSVSVEPAPDTGARFKPFALPTPSAGYDPKTLAPMGCLPGDFNEDGLTDLLVYYWGRTPVIFLRRGGTPLSTAAFVATPIAPGNPRWFTNAAIATDVDGDGHPDLLFGDYFPDGDRILDAGASGDAEMQHSMSRAYNGGRKHLYLWTGATADGVRYRDVSAAIPKAADAGWTLALAAADLSGDLRPEIYIANDFGPDRLLYNRSTPGHPAFQLVLGRRGFFAPRSKVLGRDSFKGMGVDVGGLGQDGRPRIAVSNIAQPYALMESNFLFEPTGGAWGGAVAPYRDASGRLNLMASGWGWDIKFADLDNSGRPAILQAIGFVKGEANRWPELQELAMTNDELIRNPYAWPHFAPGDDLSGHDHDRFFVMDPKGRFHDIWRDLHIDQDAVSRGIADADVYGDGRLSVVIARQWGPSVFLRNVSPNAGRAIVLDLRAPGAVGGSRPLIGAQARVGLADGRMLWGQVDGGSGHAGKRAPEIHFGLGHGAQDQPFAVQVAWRDLAGVHRRTLRLTPGRYRIVTRGDALDVVSARREAPPLVAQAAQPAKGG